MVSVTTVALLARRTDISRDLFSRYWRDVHGVTLSAWTCLRRCMTAANDQVALYRIDATYAMVESGRPTALGLCGLDAVRTIHEAGAVNQLEDAVVSAIYATASVK